MEVKHLVKNLGEVCPFSFVTDVYGLGTWTSDGLISSLEKGPTHEGLERNHEFTMCIPGEFL